MKRIAITLSAVLIVIGTSALRLSGQEGQRPGGPAAPAGARPGGPGRGGPPVNLPSVPTAVTLPTMSEEVTGPGAMFDSTPSLPGKGLSAYRYEVKEYFVSGTANGQPYKSRLVVRRPASGRPFSGLVLAESMHGSGAAHMFEFTATYTMASGHAAVEILTTSPMQLAQQNQARYADLQVGGGQASEILAQVGALVRSGKPLGGQRVRKMVLAGTSMSAGTVLNYLPAHRVFRTPDMQRIYDGFYPTSNGSLVPDVDVPVVHMPTMLEVAAPNITDRADSDEPGRQYRLYQVAGMAHIDTRYSVRLKPNPCVQPLSEFPHEAYVAMGLHHLLQWVDKGTVPPRAERIARDNDEQNDGSRMTLDEHGNPRGGIRTPYVDVPIAKYGLRPAAVSPVIPNASAYVAAGGQQAANQMCGLSGTQIPFEPAKLKALYKTKKAYASQFEKRAKELEKAGWALPVYRELIVGDAAKVMF
jgi:hypothetical protein